MDEGTKDKLSKLEPVEQEQEAMRVVLLAIEKLSPETAKRVCDWACNRRAQEVEARFGATVVDALRKAVEQKRPRPRLWPFDDPGRGSL